MKLQKNEVLILVLNNFTNDSRVLKTAISLKNMLFKPKVVALYEEPLKEYELILDIPVFRIKLKTKDWSKNKLIQLIKYAEFMYKVIKNHNSPLIHANDLNTLPIAVIKKLLNKNTKIIYDAHEFEINDIPNQSKISIKLKYFLEKILIKFADEVITVSNSIANEYAKLYNIKKPHLILNTPNLINIKKQNIFRDTLNIKENQTIFLYQGGLSKSRGIEIILETFKNIKDKNNVIVFMGYGELESLIKQEAKLNSNIYFHEAVRPEILLEYTSSADYGILFYENTCLNHDFCSPNKIFEYIMANLPFITSNLTEMKALVKTNQIGTISKENNPTSLNEAIEEIKSKDYETLLNNLEKTKQIYNWENQERVLRRVYNVWD